MLLIRNMNPLGAVRVRALSPSETPPLQQIGVSANHIRTQQCRRLHLKIRFCAQLQRDIRMANIPL